MTDKETIFVSIPSYRDSECRLTVRDLFEKAVNPARVFVGVCAQHACADVGPCFDDQPFKDQVRVVDLAPALATGPCLARHMCQALYRGEQFHLQIDSHSRFASGWDSFLVAQWLLCRDRVQHPILTTYPPDYEREPTEPKSSGAASSAVQRPTVTCASHFDDADGMLRLVGKTVVSHLREPVLARWWVAGFAFSEGSAIRRVPYDAGLPFLFFGEETGMAARFWTHGYDFFAPTRPVVFHHWSRDYRPSFRENVAKPRQQELAVRSQQFVHSYLLSDDPAGRVTDNGLPEPTPAYGLGTVRTLAQYQEFCGVDFKHRSIFDDKKAKLGGLSESDFLDNIFQKLFLV